MVDPVRSDALPEGLNWGTGSLSMGCEVNPIEMGCLTCPLDICQYEDDQAERRRVEKSDANISTVMDLRWNQHKKIREISSQLGVSERSVNRWLKLGEANNSVS